MMGEAQAALSLLNLAGKALSGAAARGASGSAATDADSFAASLDRAQRQTQPTADRPAATPANGPATQPPANGAKPTPPDRPAGASGASAPANGSSSNPSSNPSSSSNTPANGSTSTVAANGGAPHGPHAERASRERAQAQQRAGAPGSDTSDSDAASVALLAGDESTADDVRADARDADAIADAANGTADARSVIAALPWPPAGATDAATGTRLRRDGPHDDDAAAVGAAQRRTDGALTSLADETQARAAADPDTVGATGDDHAAIGDDASPTDRAARLAALMGAGERHGTTAAASSAAGSRTAAAETFAGAEHARSAAGDAASPPSANGSIDAQLAGLARSLGLPGQAHAPGATNVVQARLATPVPDPQFPRALAEQVSLFVAGDVKSANIVVSPPDMGPIRIELTVSGDDARVVFTAAHPDTRQAIEQSSAVLRSMLAERGVSLGQMDVGQGHPQQQAFAQTGGSSGGAGDGAQGGGWNGAPVDRQALTAATNAAIEQAAARRNTGLLDLFA